jgi:hypothetical protein
MARRKRKTETKDEVILGRDYFSCGSGGRGYCLAKRQDDCPFRSGASCALIRQRCRYFFKVLLNEKGKILVDSEYGKI